MSWTLAEARLHIGIDAGRDLQVAGGVTVNAANQPKGMRMKDILQELRDGRVVLGAVCNIDSYMAVEILGAAGWDFVLINTEDGIVSPYGQSLDVMIMACYAADIAPQVKLLLPDAGMIYKALNFGAKVIHVSVNNRRELEECMRAAKFPPEGNRIASHFVRGARYGAMPWNDFLESENRSVTIVPLIESQEAMDELEDILSVGGVEIAVIGGFDLACRLGGVGKPEVQKQVAAHWDRLAQVCSKKGIHVMKHVEPGEAQSVVAQGFRCLISGIDTEMLLNENVRQANSLRAELGL
jgi:2-keto-3-deoxy-L-rhamnonate aldolase RhmA